jgi:hypothetical protein
MVDSKSTINEFDKKFYFGFEETVFIDSNLIIPDSTRTYFDVPPWNILERNFVSDSSMCFKNKNTTLIKAQHNFQFDSIESKGYYFLIKIYESNSFEYKIRYNYIDDCRTSYPDKTLVGKRLILNKSEYNINDTIRGKLLLKYYVDHRCSKDSTDRFEIRIDSILFKYRLYQSTKNTIADFEKDYNK